MESRQVAILRKLLQVTQLLSMLGIGGHVSVEGKIKQGKLDD